MMQHWWCALHSWHGSGVTSAYNEYVTATVRQ